MSLKGTKILKIMAQNSECSKRTDIRNSSVNEKQCYWPCPTSRFLFDNSHGADTLQGKGIKENQTNSIRNAI